MLISFAEIRYLLRIYLRVANVLSTDRWQICGPGNVCGGLAFFCSCRSEKWWETDAENNRAWLYDLQSLSRSTIRFSPFSSTKFRLILCPRKFFSLSFFFYVVCRLFIRGTASKVSLQITVANYHLVDTVLTVRLYFFNTWHCLEQSSTCIMGLLALMTNDTSIFWKIILREVRCLVYVNYYSIIRIFHNECRLIHNLF